MLSATRRLTSAASELWRNVDAVDNRAARARVDELRKRNARDSADELHRKLVQAKCLQAGAVAAAGNLLGAVPLLGRALGPLVGTFADATVVTTLQAELVVETFILYGVELPERAERMTVAAIAATNIGSHQLAQGIAGSLARRATKWLGGPLMRYASPVARVAASTATTIAMTYAIGMRSRALAKMRHADFEDWPELIREVTALDERRLTEWAERSVRLVVEQSGSIAKGLMSKLSGLVPDLGTLSPPRRMAPGRAAPRKRPAAKKKAAPAKRARRTKPKA
jgi:uncharacterized protein (DUF697 family)